MKYPCASLWGCKVVKQLKKTGPQNLKMGSHDYCIQSFHTQLFTPPALKTYVHIKTYTSDNHYSIVIFLVDKI